MKTALRRCTPRRKKSPLRLLLGLALLLFFGGLAAGWAGASAVRLASRKNLGAPNAVLPPQPIEAPAPLPAQPTGAPPLPSPESTVPPAAPPAEPTEAPAAPSDKPASDGESWKLLLVNGENPLPEGFAAPELTRLQNGHAVDSRVYPALQRMVDDCRAAGLQPLICSSYRTEETQRQLFEQEVENWLARGYAREEAEGRAAQWVARPGASEHHTGLALDIVDLTYQVLDGEQENTAVQRWLMAHCAEYGFILRYPTDKSGLTGVNYEPWHYRYVGEAAAREIMDGGLCLEEYLPR